MRDLASYIQTRLRTPEHRFGLIAGIFCLVVVPIFLSIVLIFGEYRLQQSADEFTQFKAGVCTLLQKSNDGVPANKAFFQGAADRARLRYKSDLQLGLKLQAKADLDAAALNERIAKSIKTTSLDEFNCGSDHTPGYKPPTPVSSATTTSP